MISTILKKIINLLTKLLEKMNKSLDNEVSTFPIDSTYQDSEGRSITFILVNNLLSSDNKLVLENIFNTLMARDEFLDLAAYKVIIVTGMVDGTEFNYHHNVLMTNATTFEQYYNSVKDIIGKAYVDGYKVETVQLFKVRVWSMDHLKNATIKVTKTAGTPNITIVKRGYHTNVKTVANKP